MQHLPVAVGLPTRTRLTLYGPLLKFGQDLTVSLLLLLFLVPDMYDTYLQKAYALSI